VTTPVPTTGAQFDARARLLEALRSGRYDQARGALRITDGYCCLGVAEDVRGATWRELSLDERSDVDHIGTHAVCLNDDCEELSDTEGTQLTGAGAAWLGLTSRNPFAAVRVRAEEFDDDFDGNLDDGDQPVRWRARTLADLNDSGWSLAEVADAVQDQPSDWTGSQDAVTADAARRRTAEAITEEAP
jgi:hypothetical protein